MAGLEPTLAIPKTAVLPIILHPYMEMVGLEPTRLSTVLQTAAITTLPHLTIKLYIYINIINKVFSLR